ncbi:MAG: hypothetical protein WCC37_05765 [Candidatus Sulfotelmatobacter sp.]|jgi:hypothetical protein
MSTLTAVTVNLAEAERNLLAAQKQADREWREEARKEAEWRGKRIAELKPQLEQLAADYQIAQNQRLAAHYKVVDARAQIRYWSAEPDPMDFPSEQTLADRKQQVRLWQKREVEAIAAHGEAAKLEGVGLRAALAMKAELEALRYQYANYLRIVEGDPQSGLTIVNADFLRVPGSLPEHPAVVVPASGPRRILSNGEEPKDERSAWERL